MAKIKPTAANGAEYREIRKVRWDELWHLCYFDNEGVLTWDRVDKETALALIDRI